MIAAGRRWRLQEAKNKFSEVVRRARDEGPQVVTLRGEDVAVVVDARTFSSSSEGMSQGDAIFRAMRQWAAENAEVELDLPPRAIDSSPLPRLDDEA